MRKAQSISINTIVVAAIALVVLILIVLIFTQNISNFRKGAASCASVNGVCYKIDVADEMCSGSYEKKAPQYACYDESGNVDKTQICCIKV